jgi:hypothetical protein
MRSAIAHLAVLAIVLVGCERADQHEAKPKTKQVALENANTIVTLRDPGREPRVQLRFRPPVIGSEATYEHRVETTDEWVGHPPEKQPTLTMRISRRIAEKRADGAIRDVGTIVDVAFDRKPDDVFWQRFLRIKGSTYEQWSDARGRMLGPTTVVFDELLEKTDYESDGTPYTMVLPEEPVGVGARWEIDARTSSSHATIQVELTRSDSRSADVATTFTHENAVHGMTATGRGEVHVDLVGPDSSMRYTERMTGTVQGQHVTRDLATSYGRVP